MRFPFQFDHSGRWRRPLVTVVAAVLVASLLPAGTASADDDQAGYPPQPVAWGPCAWYSPELGGPVPECATITAPRDWAHPRSGPSVTVAISRTKATDTAHRKGVLLLNPGGPGGMGVFLSWLIGLVQPKLAAQYDLIGMDPRGVGYSTNLNCDLPLDQLAAVPSFDSRDLSPAAVAARQTVEKLIADSCAQNPLTRYVNTWQTTHDMDLIRALLGESKLNYLGYSYGTWLGAKYAALFPRRAGKIILDSNTSWMDDLANSWELMPMSFQRRFEKQFEPWTTRSKIFAKDLGTTPAQVTTSYERARAAYLTYVTTKFSDNSGGDVLDGLLLQTMYTDDGFFSAAYVLGLLKVCLVDNTDWSQDKVQACVSAYTDQVIKDLGGQLTQQVRPDLQERVTQLFGNAPVPTAPAVGQDSVASIQAKARIATGATVSINGVFYSVRCGDGGDWHSPQWWVNFARRFGPKYPIGAYQISQEVCSYWTVPTQPLPNPDAERTGPIVTVQSEFDPATAYENTALNVRRFENARLIAVDDAGAHGQYGIRGNSCVNDAVNGYLLNDVLPPSRSVCDATPLLFEDVVYPVVGPVDRSTPRKHVDDDRINDDVRKRLDKVIK